MKAGLCFRACPAFPTLLADTDSALGASASKFSCVVGLELGNDVDIVVY